MKYRWLWCLLFFCAASFAQVDSSLTSELAIGPTDSTKADYSSSLDLIYGFKSFQSNFYGQLSGLNHINTKLPLQFAGIGYSGALETNRTYTFYGQMSYCQILPQSFYVHDSLKCTLGGFIYSAFVWGKRLNLNQFNVLLSLGFNTGRLRLYDGEFANQKNPFFSPKISLQPKLALWRLVLSVRADYEFDISRPGWRRTLFSKGPTIELDRLRQSGLTLFFCLGWIPF